MDHLDPRLGAGGSSSTTQEQQQGAGASRLQSSDGADASKSGLGSSNHQQVQNDDSRRLSTGQQSTSSASGASATTAAAAAAAAAALEEEAKKARACEACRGLKVRCEPDPNDETQPCKRCKKAGRSCIVTAPSRKRQKKTDSRVADLEKKIDALTATLQARSASAGQQGTQPAPPTTGSRDDGGDVRGLSNGAQPPWGGVQSSRTWHGPSNPVPQEKERQSTGGVGRTSSFGIEPVPVTGQKRKDREGFSSSEQTSERNRHVPTPYPPMSYKSHDPDLLERGFITVGQADELLTRYNERMAPHMPCILVPPGTTASELSRTRPILFSAIMASATTDQPVLQRTLQKELMTCFAEKVFLAGDKSLDTVQAILVAVIWYWPPENFEELKFYQLIHTASVMAIDIGLGRRTGTRRVEPPFGLRDPNSKKPPPPDPTSLESRRTWLACYILATNAAMALHRTNLIRWSAFMAESVELLEKSPAALPSDKHLAQIVWAHKLSEDTSTQFCTDDPETRISLADSTTRFSLRGLERELERKRVLNSFEQPPTVPMTWNSVNLFLHELVLNNSGATGQDRAPFSTESLTVSMLSGEDTAPSTHHISALATCLVSSHNMFDIFLAMPVASARCLPVYFFVRVAYAVVVLIKMAFSAAKPGSELGRIMGPDDLKVQHYLDALLGKFRETNADDKCRPAAKFLIVLAMLRTWVSRQVQDGLIPASALSDTQRTQRQQQQQQKRNSQGSGIMSPPHPRASSSQQPASTPLHLLSEVASNRNSNNPAINGGGSSSNTPPFTQGFFKGVARVPQPFFADSAHNDSTTTPSTTTNSDATANVPEPIANPWVPQPHQTTGTGGMGFVPPPLPPPMPLDPSIPTGSLDIEGMDFSGMDVASEPWFTDMFTVMPNMENMFYF